MPQTRRHAIGPWFLAGALLLAGCSEPLAVRSVTTAVSGRATLVLTPELRAAARSRTQAVVPHLRVEDVDHVRVQLLRVAGEGEDAVRNEEGPLSVRIERSQLDRPIVLSRLSPHTRYRIRAWAYKSPDEVENTLISLETSVDVLVGDDDRPTVAPLRLQLKDVPFDGEASIPSFDIRPGGYVPEGIETVTLAPIAFQRADLSMTWIGFEADRMGRLTAGADQKPDAHLRFALDLPASTSVRAIDILAFDERGVWIPSQTWSTWDYGEPLHRLLGVVLADQLLNTDFVSHVGTFSGKTTFDLYGTSEGDFAPGSEYSVLVTLGNATALFDDFTLPAP